MQSCQLLNLHKNVLRARLLLCLVFCAYMEHRYFFYSCLQVVTDKSKIDRIECLHFHNTCISICVLKLYHIIHKVGSLYDSKRTLCHFLYMDSINKAEMRMLRYETSVSRKYRIRKENIRQTLGIEEKFSNYIGESCLRWYGYVRRREKTTSRRRPW